MSISEITVEELNAEEFIEKQVTALSSAVGDAIAINALSGSLIGEHGADLGLSDLLAYRSLLESVREWPFDAPTMLRFALYLAIPLGSWLGGAFVERLLGAALD